MSLASRHLLQHPAAQRPQQQHSSITHAARSGRCFAATSAAATVDAAAPPPGTDGDPTSDACRRTVASWRLGLLRAASGGGMSDFSHVWRVKGCTFNNRQALVPQLQRGQGVIFYREPSNQADPFAVAVRTTGMQHLGYLPCAVAEQWPLQVCFGSVLSAGQAEGVGPWGTAVQCKAIAHGIWLDLLPDSWQAAADLEQVLGAKQWAQLQQAALKRHGQRCAFSSMPADKLPQWPLRVIPQWHFDYDTKQVKLGHVIPVCEPVFQLRQQLAAAAEQLAAVAPSLQLDEAFAAAGAGAASSGSESSASSSVAAAEEMHAARCAAAEAAIAGLPAEQQEALRWLGILTPLLPVDCVTYVAQAGWRRQQLEQRDGEGWQLVAPGSAQLSALMWAPEAAKPAAGSRRRIRVPRGWQQQRAHG